MAPAQIVQTEKNKFEINHFGVLKRLTFLGESDWVLTIGENSIKNLRKGDFKSMNYTNLERLEYEHPEWKGITAILSGDCPHQAGLVKH